MTQGFEGRELSTRREAGVAGPGRLVWLQHGACVWTVKLIKPRWLQAPEMEAPRQSWLTTMFPAQNPPAQG